MKSFRKNVGCCIVSILLIITILSGCGTHYSAERLHWRAGQIAKKIIQNKSLDELTSEDYQNIIAAYRKVVKVHPLKIKAAESQFIIAQLYALQGNYSQAEKELIRITQNFSGNQEIAARAQFMIGSIYERQGDLETAVFEYEKVTDLYPTSNLGLRTPIYIAQLYQRNQMDSLVDNLRGLSHTLL